MDTEDAKIIYQISGLGADKRVFAKLDFGALEVVHLDWVKHEKDENLTSYILKLSKKVDTTKPYILCGVSFGGIIAQEMSKVTKPEKVIIISSVKTHKHVPSFMRMSGLMLPLAPKSAFSKPNPITKRAFGVEGEIWEVLKQILADQDGDFVKWSIKQLLKWRGDYRGAENITQIHGNNDKLLKCKNPDYEIDNGSHFMALDRSEEINVILKNIL